MHSNSTDVHLCAHGMPDVSTEPLVTTTQAASIQAACRAGVADGRLDCARRRAAGSGCHDNGLARRAARGSRHCCPGCSLLVTPDVELPHLHSRKANLMWRWSLSDTTCHCAPAHQAVRQGASYPRMQATCTCADTDEPYQVRNVRDSGKRLVRCQPAFDVFDLLCTEANDPLRFHTSTSHVNTQ